MDNFFKYNLKYLREKKGLSQSELARQTEKLAQSHNENNPDSLIKPITQASIARWEAGEVSPSIDSIVLLSHALNVELPDLIGRDYSFDNAKIINIRNDVVQIPVLGNIKAGIAIEAQENIIEYVDIPKSWTKGGKSYYGLLISGDSMLPKYQDKDIVIFESTSDYISANKKDCAVMVNGFDATFKNINITDEGITLIPLNISNSDNYMPTFYNNDQIQSLPIKIIGIAKEKRTRL